MALRPAERDALFGHDRYIGNRDGIPVIDRDHYNRITLADELARARAGDPTVRGRLDDLTAIAAAADQPDRYLLQLDTRGGDVTHTAIAHGNPDTADHVATYVPGTGSRPSKMGADMNRVDAMYRQAKSVGAAQPAVIAWFGYDAPQDLPQATVKNFADHAAPALDRFQDGLRASHDGSPSYNTVLGHSYGATVVGDAASHGRSLAADSVAFVASPGATVAHAGDLSLAGISHDQVSQHVFATAAAHDPVPLYPEISGYFTANYGPNPTDAGFGGRVFVSDPGTPGPWYLDWYNPAAHSQYWDQNSKSLQGMGDIIAGHGNEAVNIK
jgi:predicted alpha/beta hydrolase family esterase